MTMISDVDAEDLIRWADHRDAQATLPQLVRRLVLATGERVTRVSFRSGEGVQLAGWDGLVVAEDASALVPAGISGWELGVGKKIKGKADDDYEKRTREPGGITPEHATFVFVTPRRWPGKDEWVAARGAEKVWHEVRAYDADDLATWLEQAPAVHLWLASLLGKRPADAQDIETFWEDWTAGTRPPTPSSLLLAGRDEVVGQIREWAKSERRALSLQAESREEAVAVSAAALHMLPDDERDAVLAGTVIVRSEEAVRAFAVHDAPLTLVLDLESATAAAHAARHGHRVLVPVGRERSPGPECVSIPRLPVEEAATALAAVGIPGDRARALARLARRSLTAFRRTLAVSPELQQPAWASPEHGKTLLPAALAGTWTDACAGDREALARLGDRPYEHIAGVLTTWANKSDPPVRRVAETWYIVSREDAWGLLARYLDPDALGRFEAVAIDVLGTPDPRFDLPEGKRYMAKALGNVPRWSPVLCRGLAEILAVMATSEASSPIAPPQSPAALVAKVTHRLLRRANTDWRIWASLSEWGVLPLLAEAAPDTFLRAVDEDLTRDEPLLLRLFSKDDDGGLFVSSPHTGLLWALETLAWSEDHLGYAARLLAKLTRLDPGGRLSNRPQNSLRAIFLPWLPQTLASPERRLSVLDTLYAAEPEVAWRLMVELLPKRGDVQHPTAHPHWRNWRGGGDPRVSWAARSLVERLLRLAGQDGARWKDLVNALPNLPPDLDRAAIEGLKSLDLEALRHAGRSAIWHALRELIAHHRSFPDAAWAMPREVLDSLDTAMARFEPSDLVSRFAWLFGHRPELPEGRRGDWQAHEGEVARRQIEAARRLHKAGGIKALITVAESSDRPDSVGFAFAHTERAITEEDQLLAAYLEANDTARARFAKGFAMGRIAIGGREWAEAKARAAATAWSAGQLGELLVCLPPDPRTWDLVRVLGSDIERAYWQRMGPFGVDQADTERGARSLLEHGRACTAVEMLAYRPGVSASLAAAALEALLETPPEEVRRVSPLGHKIGELLGLLQESDEIDHGRVARLEWAYLPLLRFDRKPRVLHAELARNPEFFVEIVGWVFRAEGEEPSQLSEEEHDRALLAYELLESWRTVPGDSGDGSVDGNVLMAWVARARDLLSVSGHTKIGDEVIGQMLSGSPADVDGVWPHPAVCDVIEQIGSDPLERGIELGRFNSRGVSWRDLDAGGEQERELAEGYERNAQVIADRWPRTAAMLRRIAGTYLAEAAREDREAELRQDLGR